MKINKFNINQNSPCFIIAELSANHGGDIKIAKESIRAAKRSGANAIKLQTYKPETMTLNVQKPDFKINGTIWDGKYLYELYSEACTPWEWHEELFQVAYEEDIICFSTPFDFSSVDFLESLNVPAYKIASFEITDIPLIEYIASKGKPVILSTGVATLEDIESAIATCKQVNNNNIALLKCTSAYPAPIEEANLIMIQEYANKFNVIPGLSDHSLGISLPIIAVSLGAKVIEKHFILDKSIGGPDAKFSLSETEFKNMVTAVRDAEKAIGTIDYSLTTKQIESKKFSRSLYFIKGMKKGDVIKEDSVKPIRPGFGMHPKYLKSILGKTINSDVEKGDRVLKELINEAFN